MNKGISSVNASDNAVIYLSADLSINLAHKNYNGSLTIIGASNGQTILDGNDETCIFKSISADSIVTLINITFTHGKAKYGSAITTSGNLTIDNCTFDSNYATNLATIYTTGINLKITNSIFKNDYGVDGFADIYASGTNIDIINSTFINSTSGYSEGYNSIPSLLITSRKANIIGNRFENMTGSYESGTFKLESEEPKIINNTFINCNYTGSETGGIISFLNAYIQNNIFINCNTTKALINPLTNFNAYLKFKNLTVNGTEFKLICEVTDDLNNSVSTTYGKVHFFIDSEDIGSSKANNGIASLIVNKLLENGDYTLSGTYYHYENNPFEVNVKNATIHVDFNHDPLELWVSNDGNDITGNGSKNNPFKSLKHALNYGFENTINLTIHMKNGIYNGDDNRNLHYSNIAKLTIIGESYKNTIIDAEKAETIFTFGNYLNVTLKNMTLKNTSGYVINAYMLKIYDSIIENVGSFEIQYSDKSKIIINNLTYSNSGSIQLYNPEIYNSEFKNCNILNKYYFLMANALGEDIIHVENTTIINNSNIHGSVFSASGNLIRLINNNYINNSAHSAYSNFVFYHRANKITSINETFIGNNVTNYIASFGPFGTYAEIIIENITFRNNYATNDGAGLIIQSGKIKGGKFINNTALNNGGAITILPHHNSNQLPDIILENVSFENNSATNGKDIFIKKGEYGQVNGQLENITVNFNNLITKTPYDTVTANITHPSGATIGGGIVTFNLNGSYMGIAEVINGMAKLSYLGFENGNYSLSGTYDYGTNTTKYNNAFVNVTLNLLKENITLYVSDSRGNDENGDGSYENPYKTIGNALNDGYKQSKVILIKILEGNYSGEFNNNIKIYDFNITLIGEGIDKTIITDNTTNNCIITVLNNSGKGLVKLINMTISDAQKTAIFIEKNTNVFIDNVKFTKNHGTSGGAINNKGTLNIINSIFYNNGNSNIYVSMYEHGGAIYNSGITTIDNSTFIANYALSYANIYNNGILNISNSNIQDPIRVFQSWKGNAISIGGPGNMNLINSKIFRSGKSVSELIGSNDTNTINLHFVISISAGKMLLKNTTIDGNDANYYVSGGSTYYNAAIITDCPSNIEIYNTTFLNLNNILFLGHETTIDINESYIRNVSSIVEKKFLIDYNLTVSNSYFADGTISTYNYNNSNICLNNNWWGSNFKPTYKVANVDTNPETWLILTLNQSALSKNIILAFKVSDGENITDYTGQLYPRHFTMSSINGTLKSANGTIINHITNLIKIMKNATSYYVEATVDNQTVNLTQNITHNVTIVAKDIIIDYGTTTINVNVLFDNQPADNETITLNLNNKKYTAKTNNGTATFNIDIIPHGTYTLKYIINATKLHGEVLNSSNLTINRINANINATSHSVIVGNDVKVEINLPKDLTGTINVLLNNKTYQAEITNNKAIAIIPNLAQGEYIAKITYSGDDKYLPTNTTVNIKVLGINITAPDVEKYYKGSEKLQIITKDSEGNAIIGQNIQIKLNGKNYTATTNNEGIASIELDLNIGKYSATIIFNDKKINASITIKSTIHAPNMTRGYNSGLDYQTTLLNVDGTPLSHTNITFNIQGKTYSITTDAKGVAKLNKKLAIGTYNILIINPTNLEKQTKTLKIISRINNNKNLIGDYLSGLKYKIRIIDDNGKTAGTGKIVKITINKKTYNIPTDKNGYATLKITLTPKTYYITATYKNQT
uniref:hypothetical protein n=1 Tax=Methanobrevibacter oralis TaxID=66851 RepID=UPI001C73DC5E